MTDEK